MYPFCFGCDGIAPQRTQGGKSQSLQRHVAASLCRCLAGEKACAGFVRVQRLHFIVFAEFAGAGVQFPHLAKYNVDVSTSSRSFAVSNLWGGSAQLHTVHVYRVCVHVSL